MIKTRKSSRDRLYKIPHTLDHRKYLGIKKCFEAVDYLLHLDRFISRREYQPFLDGASATNDELMTMDRNGILDDFARKNRF